MVQMVVSAIKLETAHIVIRIIVHLTSRSSSFAALTGQSKPALLRIVAPVCPAA
jgi:hypothetical protein